MSEPEHKESAKNSGRSSPVACHRAEGVCASDFDSQVPEDRPHLVRAVIAIRGDGTVEPESTVRRPRHPGLECSKSVYWTKVGDIHSRLPNVDYVSLLNDLCQKNAVENVFRF
jgi:hypothetical protein